MKNTIIAVVSVVLILLISFGAYKLFTNKPEEPIVEPTPTSTVEEVKETLFTEETYPRIDGSTATIPLSEAFKADALGKEIKDISVKHNTTHYAYENLIKGDADLILVTSPSDEELKMAEDAGVELEVIPVKHLHLNQYKKYILAKLQIGLKLVAMMFQ